MVATDLRNESLEILQSLLGIYQQEDPFLSIQLFLKNNAGPTIEKGASVGSCRSTYFWYERVRNALVYVKTSLETLDGLMYEANPFWIDPPDDVVKADEVSENC